MLCAVHGPYRATISAFSACIVSGWTDICAPELAVSRRRQAVATQAGTETSGELAPGFGCQITTDQPAPKEKCSITFLKAKRRLAHPVSDLGFSGRSEVASRHALNRLPFRLARRPCRYSSGPTMQP